MQAERLGERVSVHMVDNRRRYLMAVGVLVVAIVALGVAVPGQIARSNGSWGAGPGEPGYKGLSRLLGLALGVGLFCLCAGVYLLVKAVRTKGESFELHQHGIVHSDTRTRSAIYWTDIVSVRLRRTGTTQTKTLLGNEFQCILRLADGRRLKFNNFTYDAQRLALTIEANVDRARDVS